MAKVSGKEKNPFLNYVNFMVTEQMENLEFTERLVVKERNGYHVRQQMSQDQSAPGIAEIKSQLNFHLPSAWYWT